MSQESQAAQEIKDAAIDAFWLFHPGQAAAILRAAADQVVPEHGEPVYGECDHEVCDVVIHLDQQRTRAQLLAIAAELEAQ